MRIAVVAPRYGAEIGGGAENLARDYATRLAARHEVSVLTTCALDYRTWADHFPAGESRDADARVLRFPVPEPREVATFDRISARLMGGGPAGPEAEDEWMDAQGPNAPGLLEHLRREGSRYDAVLFVPYIYATTVRGLPLVADRAVLVPALHDEPWLRLGIFDRVVAAARAIVCLTPEESELVGRRFGVSAERRHLVGAGIDSPPESDPERARTALGLRRPYALALGRIDPSKGSDALLSHHAAYRRVRPDGLDLAMLGRAAMDLPAEPWLVAPGFVSEELKHHALAGAALLVAPSPYESLSIALLEAWAHGLPTVSSAASEVLVGQSRRAGGGLWYRDADEYVACLDLLTSSPALGRALGRSGWRFARGLSWPAVTRALEEVLADVAGARLPEPDETPDVEDPSAPAPVLPPTPPAPAPPPPAPRVVGAPLLVAASADTAAAVEVAIARAGVRALLHVLGGPTAVPRAVALVNEEPAALAARLAGMDALVGDLGVDLPSLSAEEPQALADALRALAAPAR